MERNGRGQEEGVRRQETGDSGTFGGQDFNIHSSRTTLASLAQIDLGARYYFNSRLSTQFGYRLVGVSGVALTGPNFAREFSDLTTIRHYDASSAVLIHGGYAGVTYAW